MKKLILTIGFIAALVIVVFVIQKVQNNDSAFVDKPDLVKRTRFLMDTFCSIKVPVAEQNIETTIEAAFDRMEEVDKKFNCLNPDSPLYDFNLTGTAITDVEIVNLVKTALKVSEESGGAFDITIEPVVALWGFFTSNPHLPAKEEIKEALEKVGYKHITVENNTVSKDNKDVRIDLGAIAKGYGLGESVKTLKENGISSALIEAGGQVYSFGLIEGKPWTVGIRNPRESGVIAGLGFDDNMCVATSGDYERYFEEKGQRYHHIIDPKTGYPAEGTMSLSVIIKDPVLADAYSTALFIMGHEKAMEFANANPEVNIIVVTADGNIEYSQTTENKLINKN